MAETEVHLPDGRVVYFPDGMSADDINKAAASLTANAQTHDAKPAEAAEQPSMFKRAMDAAYDAVTPDLLKPVIGYAADHPVQTASALGATAAVPLTGGASLVPAMLAAGLGGAGGAGLAIAGRQLASGTPEDATDTLKTMGKEGLAAAAGEGVGRTVVTPLTELAAKGAYRYALLPIQKVLGKYGDVVDQGLSTMTPVDAGGLAATADRKAAAIADKQTALNASTATTPVSDITANAQRRLAGKADALKDAGVIGAADTLDPQIMRFADRHAATPDMTSPQLDAIKSTLDDRLGPAFKAVRAKEPLSVDDEGSLALRNAIDDQLQGVPGYADANKNIMADSGLQAALARRVSGSGANQGLEKVVLGGAAAAGHPAALLGLIAAHPAVMSRLAIGADQTAKSGFLNMLLRAAGAEEPDPSDWAAAALAGKQLVDPSKGR